MNDINMKNINIKELKRDIYKLTICKTCIINK